MNVSQSLFLVPGTVFKTFFFFFQLLFQGQGVHEQVCYGVVFLSGMHEVLKGICDFVYMCIFFFLEQRQEVSSYFQKVKNRTVILLSLEAIKSHNNLSEVPSFKIHCVPRTLKGLRFQMIANEKKCAYIFKCEQAGDD